MNEYAKAGRVRPLATTGKTRSDGAPECADDGRGRRAGYEAVIWLGVMAPKGTPPAIVNRLNAEIRKIVSRARRARGMGEAGRGRDADDAGGIRPLCCRRHRQVGARRETIRRQARPVMPFTLKRIAASEGASSHGAECLERGRRQRCGVGAGTRAADGNGRDGARRLRRRGRDQGLALVGRALRRADSHGGDAGRARARRPCRPRRDSRRLARAHGHRRARGRAPVPRSAIATHCARRCWRQRHSSCPMWNARRRACISRMCCANWTSTTPLARACASSERRHRDGRTRQSSDRACLAARRSPKSITRRVSPSSDRCRRNSIWRPSIRRRFRPVRGNPASPDSSCRC